MPGRSGEGWRSRRALRARGENDLVRWVDTATHLQASEARRARVAWRMTARRQSRRDQARRRAPAMGISVFASAKKSQKVLRFAQVRQLRRQRPNVRADMHKPGNAATGATSPSISLVGSPIDQRSGSTWGPVRPATMPWMPRREICSATSARTLSSTTLCLSGATPRWSS